MLRRVTGRVLRTRALRRWHVSTEDILTSAVAALVGGAVAVPLVGWNTSASPSAWAALVTLAVGLGAVVAGLRTLWSDDRVAARAARRPRPVVVGPATCARWQQPRQPHRPCRHATGRRTRPCMHPRTAERHAGRAGRPTAARAHRPKV